MSEIERKYLETKVAIDDAGTVAGIAWPFGSPDRTGDEIEPSAFKAAVGMTLPMLFAHDQRDTVGVWNAITVSAKGLEVKGPLLTGEVSRAAEVKAMMLAGAVRGLSIGFITKAAKARAGGGRTITALNLLEISLVAVPAHPGARVTSVKNYDDAVAFAAAVDRAIAALRAPAKG
jgi:HK97 family phage prohead protease